MILESGGWHFVKLLLFTTGGAAAPPLLSIRFEHVEVKLQSDTVNRIYRFRGKVVKYSAGWWG